MDIVEKLLQIYHRKKIPQTDEYLKKIRKVSEILDTENRDYRPAGRDGKPGGLLILNNMLTIIVPDLHARMDLFLHLLFTKIIEGAAPIDLLKAGKCQIVCVGDGFHTESGGTRRWQKAYREFQTDFKLHQYMDEEMTECLGLMEMVVETKIRFPETFHFLKGNHENISNEEGKGNHQFGKFVSEGEMTASWIEIFYGESFRDEYNFFEKKLPVFAAGRNFLISHAEPETFYSKDKIINYSRYPEVIYGLTWTADNSGEEDSVQKMLDEYITDKTCRSFYFGGHRPIHGLYNLRANGKYVQIHNPDKYILAIIKNSGDIILKNDIIEIIPDPNLIATIQL